MTKNFDSLYLEKLRFLRETDVSFMVKKKDANKTFDDEVEQELNKDPMVKAGKTNALNKMSNNLRQKAVNIASGKNNA